MSVYLSSECPGFNTVCNNVGDVLGPIIDVYNNPEGLSRSKESLWTSVTNIVNLYYFSIDSD